MSKPTKGASPAQQQESDPDRDIAATVLDAYANALTAQTLLTSKGALRRTLQVATIMPVVRLLRWWPRTWVGRVLGLGWCVAVFRDAYSGEIWRERDEPYTPPPQKRPK